MLNKTTLTALGAALIALGQELQGGEPEAGAPAEQPTTTRRGRGPAKEPAQTPPAEPAKEKPAAPGVPEADLRALIAPLVQEQGRGAEVKALIAKHGGTKLRDLPPPSHAAFVRDIEGLLI